MKKCNFLKIQYNLNFRNHATLKIHQVANDTFLQLFFQRMFYEFFALAGCLGLVRCRSAFMRENPKNEWNFMQFYFYKKANVVDVGS